MPWSVFRPHAICFATALLVSGNALAVDVEEKVKLCATCHGEQGIPINKQTPVIWGQDEGYLYLQLRDFKSGVEPSTVMGRHTKAYTDSEIAAVAKYIADLSK